MKGGQGRYTDYIDDRVSKNLKLRGYPCEDFPEYDGKSVIELGKLGNLG
jgi:hypothetical protein